jgi:hypothetical protein
MPMLPLRGGKQEWYVWYIFQYAFEFFSYSIRVSNQEKDNCYVLLRAFAKTKEPLINQVQKQLI